MQILRNRLVGVRPMDPVVWGSAAVLWVALAPFIPARNATRVNPAETRRAL